MNKLSNDMVKGIILGILDSGPKTLDDLNAAYGEILRTFVERGVNIDELKNVEFLPQKRLLNTLQVLKHEGLIKVEEVIVDSSVTFKDGCNVSDLNFVVTFYRPSLGVDSF